MRSILFCFFCFFSLYSVHGQLNDAQKILRQKALLANEYFHSGEYEKAADLYLNVHNGNIKIYNQPNGMDYYQQYIKCLLELKQYDTAEKQLKKQINSYPNYVELYVTYGSLKERLSKTKEALKLYNQAIDKLESNPKKTSQVGRFFTLLAKNDLALKAYETGSKYQNSPYKFSREIADLYFKKGNIQKAISHYLDASLRQKSINYTVNRLQAILKTDEDYAELQAQLYERLDEQENNVFYIQLLSWTFIHKKQYRKAFRQARSLDRQNDENGNRVFNVAKIAYNDGDYDTAMEALDYIVKNKGVNTSYYLDSKRLLLKSKQRILTSNFVFEKSDFDSLKVEYIRFLDEFGRNTQTSEILVDYADLNALYLGDLKTAVEILEEVVKFPIKAIAKGKAKIKLADYMLMKGDVWESTLLYSQVDKSLTETDLGEEARFKNAMFSYYNGNFEWAQEQFSILKHATSRLISNDAIDMAIFILDNLGLDTTAVPMQMFSNADLLLFQNRYEEAFAKWDSLEILFPDHGLADDILYKKASIYTKQQRYQEAAIAYDSIITNFPEEIFADNAAFKLAELYEGPLQNPENAKELYQRLILDFSGSTFAVLARERYAILEKELQ